MCTAYKFSVLNNHTYIYQMENTLFRKFTLLFVVFYCLIFSTQAQISYDFKVPLPPDGTQTASLNSSFFGTYTNSDSPVTYEINKDGIFIVSINVNSVSREMIRESSKYQVRNNHIFGVHAEDSIPCVLEGDKYYFGIKNKDQIAGLGSQNVLMQLSINEYILNFEENGNYTPMFIKLDGRTLSIMQFDYTSDTKLFKKIDARTSIQHDIEFVTLHPTKEEWTKMKVDEMKGTAVVYQRK